MTTGDIIGILGFSLVPIIMVLYVSFTSLKKESSKKLFLAVISIVLCITIYLILLTSIFTKQVDTYICYTTATGECYHSETCRYLRYSSYKTTVYEAAGEYRSCSYCNPKVKKYETVFIDRNYVAPFFISVPASIGVYLLLTVRKKEKSA